MYAPRHLVKFLVRVNLPGNKPVSDSHSDKHSHVSINLEDITLTYIHVHTNLTITINTTGRILTLTGPLSPELSQVSTTWL